MNGQPRDETASDDRLQRQPTETNPPRVWTVFATLGVAFLLATLFQVGLVAVLALPELGRGVEPAKLGELAIDRLASPYLMISMMAVGQLAMGAAVFFAASLSPVPFRERVTWAKAQPSWRIYPMAMVGSIVPLAIGLTSAEAMPDLFPESVVMLKFFDAITVDSAIVFVLFIGIVPGLVEEALFRGYAQQRLVKRWGAATGIVVTSLLFTLFHVTPPAMAVALPLGFWFGYLAWRTSSVIPTMLCHFFVNSGLNAWRMIVKFGDLSETTQSSVHLVLLSIGVICCAVCCLPSFWRKGAATE